MEPIDTSIPEQVQPKKLTAGQQWMLMENLGLVQTTACTFRRRRRIPASALLVAAVLCSLGIFLGTTLIR